MFSNETVELRKLLRHIVTATFPTLSTDQIYDKIKPKFQLSMTTTDLKPFCKAIELPFSKLTIVLTPYGIYDQSISKKNWKCFMEDEFSCSFPTIPIPSKLTSTQTTFFSRFVNIIGSRASSINQSRHSFISDQWCYVARFNPTGSKGNTLRLSAFCHILKELDILIKPEDFINAMFVFFGKKLEELDYQEFAQFIQAFNTIPEK